MAKNSSQKKLVKKESSKKNKKTISKTPKKTKVADESLKLVGHIVEIVDALKGG